MLVTPREMSPSKLIPSATFRIKLDIDVKSGSIIKLHIKPTIKYFFNTVFNPSVINPYFLPEEIEYSVEIIKKVSIYIYLLFWLLFYSYLSSDK